MKVMCADPRVAGIVTDTLPPTRANDDRVVVVVRVPREISTVLQMLNDHKDDPGQLPAAIVTYGLDMVPQITLINAVNEMHVGVPVLIGVGGRLGTIDRPVPLADLITTCRKIHSYENMVSKLPSAEVS